MKKKAIKIAASTAVAASAFVAVAPAQQADAATNVTTLATNAQNAGTVLKWAISYEGSADFATRPFNEFNAAKKAVAAAEAAAAKLSTTEKLSLQAKLVDAKIQIVRATAYIDAITSSEKIKSLTSNLNAAIATGDLGKVETAYHAASFEYKKQAKLLDRVYGQSTRDGIRNAVKPAMEAALEAVKYDVTVKMHIDKASALIKEGKLEEAAAELAKADYNLTLKDAKFTFKTQLQKSFDDAAVSLPLQAISAVGDGANTVTVKFSKAYTLDKNLTTLEAGQFKINGLTVQSAKLSEDKKSVVLTTSTQKANTEYTVTWQGKSVSFKTAAVADTSGIAVNENDDAYVETTQSRTYNAKLTNTDGTPYVGRVTVNLNNVLPTVAVASNAVITTVNGQPQTTPSNSWTGVTDSNGNLVFTVAAANNASASTTSVTHVEPTISKLDGDKKSKEAAVTHFFQLQATNVIEDLTITDLYVSAANDYVYAEGKKYKWDANDAFFIRGQKVSQEAFEAALSDGDTLTVDYKTIADNVSTWNITVDVTKSAGVSFTNPKADVRFDGFNYDLSGKGQAGNTVKVYRGTDLLGSAVVDANGVWTLKAVNLTQDVKNTFTAYQYTPGTDGVNGVGSVNSKSVTISEGAFASTGIAFNDTGDAGLSIGDTLDFTFLNNDSAKAYGHTFKKDLTGTITVGDGLGKTAKVNVEYVDADTLKVVSFVSKDDTFKNNSLSLTISETTGIVNQDQLAYNVTASTGKTLGAVSGPVVSGTGYITLETTDAIVVNGIVYPINATTSLKNSAGTVTHVGAGLLAAIAPGDQVTVNGNVITLNSTVAQQTTALATLVAGFSSPATQAQVTAARTAYNALSTEAKAAATASLATIVAAEDVLVAAPVAASIAALPLAANVTLAHKAQIESVRAAFDPLTATQKTAVGAITKLTDAETALAALVTAAADTKAVADATAALTTLAVGTPSALSPTIAVPVTGADGVVYTFGAPTNFVGNTGATPGSATNANPVVITRDSATLFTFEITVTLTKNAASSTKTFVVTVPTAGSAVTVSPK